jgi:hypothetical protein
MLALYLNGVKVGTLDENPDVLKQLIESGQPVEFRSDNGTELGAFLPKIEEVELTPEQIDRKARESKRTSINDILARLGVV